MLNPLKLQSYLNTQQLGRPLIQLCTLKSTNQTLLEWLKLEDLDLPFGSTLIATQQQAGQGQYGRSWLSEPGGIYLSVVMDPQAATEAMELTLALAWGVVAQLRASLNLSIQLKWPNDLVIADQKLGGLLIQSRSQSGVITAAVVGLGLNVHNAIPEVGVTLSHLISVPPLESLVALVLLGLEQGYLGWQTTGLAEIQADYEAWMTHINQVIKLSLKSGETTTGTVLGIAKSGALRVQTHRGVLCLHSGEVQLGYVR